jgi:hypothetical protein
MIMKRLITIYLVIGLVAAISNMAAADVTIPFDPDWLIQQYPSSEPTVGDTFDTQLNARRLVEPPGGYQTPYYASDPDLKGYANYVRWANSLGAGEGISSFQTVLRPTTSPFWGRTVVVNPAGPAPTATVAAGWTAAVTAVGPGLGWVIDWTRTTGSYINMSSTIGEFSFTAPLYEDNGDGVYGAGDTPVGVGDAVRLVFGSYNTWAGYIDSESPGHYGYGKYSAADTRTGVSESLTFDALGWSASPYGIDDDYYTGGVAWDKEDYVGGFEWPWIMAWKAPFGNEAAIAYALDHDGDVYYGDLYGVDTSSGIDTWGYYGPDGGYWGSAYQGTLNVETIPEPVTFALLGLGGLFLRRRK